MTKIMTEPGIKLAQENDLEELISFLKLPVIDNMFVRPLSQRSISVEKRVREKYEKGKWILLVDDDKIVGCRGVVYDEEKNTVQFSTFAIHPDYHGRGFGNKVYQYSIDLSKSSYHPKKILVDSWGTNIASKKMAEKFGFVKIKEFEDPDKRPPGITTVVYELNCNSV